MTETSRHDAWQAGDSYDTYMGRWSRLIAPRFLDWLDLPRGLNWLEVGCGTGALSAAILAQCRPKSLIAIDPSEGFVAASRARVPDESVEFRVGDAQTLTLEPGSRDAIVSALVLNFVPDKAKALAEMKRVARTGGSVGFYVWDYPGGGLEFVDAFWTCAAAIPPAAVELDEGRRFRFCTPDGLTRLATAAGLTSVDCIPIEVPTVFEDFDDFGIRSRWAPARRPATAPVLILRRATACRRCCATVSGVVPTVRFRLWRGHGRSGRWCLRRSGAVPASAGRYWRADSRRPQPLRG